MGFDLKRERLLGRGGTYFVCQHEQHGQRLGKAHQLGKGMAIRLILISLLTLTVSLKQAKRRQTVSDSALVSLYSTEKELTRIVPNLKRGH